MPITTISEGVHKLFASHNEKCPPFTLKFGELFDTVSKDGSTSELFPRVSPPDMFSDYSPCVLSMCVVRVRLPRGVLCPSIYLPPAPPAQQPQIIKTKSPFNAARLGADPKEHMLSKQKVRKNRRVFTDFFVYFLLFRGYPISICTPIYGFLII